MTPGGVLLCMIESAVGGAPPVAMQSRIIPTHGSVGLRPPWSGYSPRSRGPFMCLTASMVMDVLCLYDYKVYS